MNEGEPAVVMQDTAGLIIGWDRGAERLFGYLPSEVLGRPFSVLAAGEVGAGTSFDCMCSTFEGVAIRAHCERSTITDASGQVRAIVDVMTSRERPTHDRARDGAVLRELRDRLRRQQARLRSIMATIPGAVISYRMHTDGSSDLLFVSEASQDVYGYSPAEMQASWSALRSRFDAQDTERLQAQVRESERTGLPWHGEVRYQHPTKGLRWLEAHIMPLPEHGEMTWSGVVFDITARREDEDQLRQTQTQLESALDGADIGAWVWDLERKLSWGTPELRRLWGVPDDAPEWWAAEDSRSKVHPDDRPRLDAEMARSLASGTPAAMEFRVVRAPGDERWVSMRARLEVQTDGRQRFAGVTTDITEQRKAVEHLRWTTAHLDHALEVANMGAWAWDLERKLAWGSKGLRQLFAFGDDVPEWHDPEVARRKIHPEDLARSDVEIQRGIATGAPFEVEFRLIRMPDDVRWVLLRGRVVRLGGDGGRPWVLGIDTDMTQQKLAAEGALRAQKLEALGTLAGGIAHDFNNLLFAISGNAALALQDKTLAERTRKFIREITVAGARATELVKQILAFSRPQEQKVEVIDASAAVREALSLVRATTPAMIVLKSNLDESTPATFADPARLVQVLVNLCTNAVHAIGKNKPGNIRITLNPITITEEANGSDGSIGVPPGYYAQLCVTDDGSGMDEATRARVFDPFFTTKPPGEGTGLGLSVVHGIVKALSGHLTVSSKLGQGSTFCLYFPAAEGSAAVAAECPPKLLGHGQRILLVEDEPMLLELGVSLLVTLGYRAEAFQRGADALSAFRADPRRYAAVVTDISMPGMSGFELAQNLLALRPELPILAVSGNAGPEEYEQATRIGVRDLALKPLTFDELAQRLATLCQDT